MPEYCTKVLARRRSSDQPALPGGDPNIKRLSDRERVCLKCGLVTTRDHASAMDITKARTEPSVANRGPVMLCLTKKPPVEAEGSASQRYSRGFFSSLLCGDRGTSCLRFCIAGQLCCDGTL